MFVQKGEPQYCIYTSFPPQEKVIMGFERLVFANDLCEFNSSFSEGNGFCLLRKLKRLGDHFEQTVTFGLF